MNQIQEETELTARLICFTEREPFSADPKLYGFSEDKRLIGTFSFDEEDEELSMYNYPSAAIELLSHSQYAVFRSAGVARPVKDNEVDYVAGPRRVMLCVGFGVENREFSFASTIIFEDDQDNPMTSEEGNGQLRTWLSLMFIQAIEKRLSR